MRYLCLLLFSFIFYSFNTYSQTVITRPYSKIPLRWIEDSSDYELDTTKTKLKSPNPLIILSFEEITIIDGDTTKIYLNEVPDSEEDSTMIVKKWYDTNDMKFRECYVFLFYYKNDNEYTLRILYKDDNRGFEYYLRPLRVDVIPYKQN